LAKTYKKYYNPSPSNFRNLHPNQEREKVADLVEPEIGGTYLTEPSDVDITTVTLPQLDA
jgi:hypothetical protein